MTFPIHHNRNHMAQSVVALLLFSATAYVADAQGKTFPTAHEAAQALFTAIQSDDLSALSDILGPDSKELVSSGDDVADKNARARFAKSYDEQHRFVSAGVGKLILHVGASDWPLPIPLAKTEKGWAFDTEAGKQEVLYRRIGRNELDAIRVCRAIIDAERAYKQEGHDGNPPGVYTRKLRSDPGTQNGLYWEEQAGESASPGGPLLAEAEGEGYDIGTGKHNPFYGYLFHVLTAQGSHAHNGARDYLVDGKLTRGFAIVAYPVDYRSSGVMTFIVNQHGTVYQKDLGPDTRNLAKALTTFDPDPSWKVSQ